MHTPKSIVVAPLKPARGWAGAGNSMGMTMSLTFQFAWMTNQWDEAWVEVAVPGTTFLLELPYGFIRDPIDVLSPADPERNRPIVPKIASGDAVFVPWHHVEYDLAWIIHEEGD